MTKPLLEFNTILDDHMKSIRQWPVYRCPAQCLAPGEFSGGRQHDCDGIAVRDGFIGGCGEPCEFIMHNPYSGTKQ